MKRFLDRQTIRKVLPVAIAVIALITLGLYVLLTPLTFESVATVVMLGMVLTLGLLANYGRVVEPETVWCRQLLPSAPRSTPGRGSSVELPSLGM